MQESTKNDETYNFVVSTEANHSPQILQHEGCKPPTYLGAISPTDEGMVLNFSSLLFQPANPICNFAFPLANCTCDFLKNSHAIFCFLALISPIKILVFSSLHILCQLISTIHSIHWNDLAYCDMHTQMCKGNYKTKNGETNLLTKIYMNIKTNRKREYLLMFTFNSVEYFRGNCIHLHRICHIFRLEAGRTCKDTDYFISS